MLKLELDLRRTNVTLPLDFFNDSILQSTKIIFLERGGTEFIKISIGRLPIINVTYDIILEPDKIMPVIKIKMSLSTPKEKTSNT